ncbi:MAG: AAA family ATPase [Chloroflexi bacterium]|nr:AAA family ATPase [Chloroflexota bacterium]
MPVPFAKSVICPVLIGRSSYLETLRQCIDQAKNKIGQTVLISGEAGIGKSRLVAEAKADAIRQGFLVLQGNCFQSDPAYPYAPLLDLLRPTLSVDHLEADAPQWASMTHELSRLLPDLMPLSGPLEPAPIHEADQNKRRLFAALLQVFNFFVARQPVLMIVEDVHWSDDTSLEFLHQLAWRSKAQPLLLLATYRSDEMRPALTRWLAQLDRAHLASELALPRLTRAEVDEMLAAIFERRRPGRVEFLDTIYGLTEGNPFFIEEILKSLVAAGDIHAADDIWTRKALDELHVPRSIQAAVQQRVGQLSDSAKQTVVIAAVAGRRFDLPLLQRVLHCDEDHLIPLMKELIAAQLVVEEPADRFAFRHALIREAISGELLARERRLLHRAIAEALESLSAAPSGHPSGHDAHVTDLASHFYAAGIWAKALEYGQRAGESALALYAPHAAIEHMAHALDAAHRLQVTTPGTLYHIRGRAYETLGEFDRARSDYERALDTAHAASDGSMEWQSMMALGLLWAGRDYAQAGTWFRRASVFAERLADPTLQARSLNRLGNWLENTGQTEEGLQAHQAALRIFEGQQNSQGMAETLDLLAIAYGMRADRVKAVEQLGQAIALFGALGDTHSLVSSLAMRALQSMPGASETTVCPLRTRDACVHDASESLRLARQIDSFAGQAFAENALAHTLLSFGEFGPALSHAQEAQRIATEIEHQQWMIATAYGLGHIYMLLLAPAPAMTVLEAGGSLAHELGSTFWIATLAALQARALILNHDLPAAKATLQAVMPGAQHPQTVTGRQIALVWGELMLAQGEPDMALQMAQQLESSAPSQAPDQPRQPIPHLLKLKGEALMALSRPDEAVEAFEAAKRGAQERHERPVLWTIHRALGQAYRVLRRKDQARHERAAAQHLIEELATTMHVASLRDQFLRKALDSLPKEKPPLLREIAKQAFGGLTAREREVAALIAQGRTSREIADLLVLSERTVEVHVSNILGKLNFTSRAQIAAWAVERGLTKR